MIKENESKPLSHNEVLKEADPIPSGNWLSTLLNPEADRFSNDDGQFLKFHGIYQQDDRDLEKDREKVHVHDPRAHRQRYSHGGSIQSV